MRASHLGLMIVFALFVSVVFGTLMREEPKEPQTLAALVASRTELLAVVLGSLFVAEVTSVVLQILAFRTTGRRVFRMAPFHHHFELAGWAETTVIIRFWLLTAITCGLGVALFYGEWLAAIGA